MKIVYDTHAQTYITVNLPHHTVTTMMEEYRELDNYQRKGIRMDFVQFLIWENEKDINPDLIHETNTIDIPEV